MPRSQLSSPPASGRSEAPKPCRPTGRTLGEFGKLSAAEKTLIDCCCTGVPARVGEERPAKSTSANRVRASLIRFLALGGDEDAPVHEYGVALRGAWVTGVLAFEDSVLPRCLELQNCWVSKITAWRATVPMLILSGSYLHKGIEASDIRSSFGIWLDGVTTEGPIGLSGARLGGEFIAAEATFKVPKRALIALNLSSSKIDGRAVLNSARANGTVSFDGASIGGDLECVGAQFRSEKGFALSCDGTEVGHSVFMREGFRADGGVRMLGAKIGLALDCSNAHFEGTTDRALECERLVISGHVFLTNGKFAGSVSFHTASIGGTLLADKASFEFPDGETLDCSAASIASVRLGNGFSAKGEVSFVGAQIKGKFHCSGARLENPGRIALNLDDASVALSVLIEDETHVSGAVTLSGANIGRNVIFRGVRLDLPQLDPGSIFDPITENSCVGSLSMSRASIAGNIILETSTMVAGPCNLSGIAVAGSLQCLGEFNGLVCDRCSISGNVRLAFGFTAADLVTFGGAKIGGDLDCGGGSFQGNELALNCDNAAIAGNVELAGIKAAGTVNLDNATIGKSLKCELAEFDNQDLALTLESTNVAGTFAFSAVKRLNGPVSLIAAHASALDDDLASWSGASGQLFLDGFTYDRFTTGSPTGASDRVAWLEHQWPHHLGDEFRPQPWEQLIAALRASGHPNNARAVAIARNDRLRRAGKVVLGARTLHWLYGAFVGYGYRPVKLLGAIIAVWLICAFAYDKAAAWPTPDESVLTSKDPKSGNLIEGAESFSPLFYSADVLLPIVDLGYSDTWKPAIDSRQHQVKAWAEWLRVLRWLEIIVGWLFGGALAAMLTQLVKKD